MNHHKEYLDSFEKRVIIQGLYEGKLGKLGMITIRECKLSNTQFGKFVGTSLEYSVPMAIDYYGLIKKSTGVLKVVDGYKNVEIKSILIPVVYFASIRHEDIMDLANDLLNDFPLFKKFLIELRGFKANQIQ